MSRETDTEPTEGKRTETTERSGRTAAFGPAARQALAVAALFALLGGALVRLATVDPPPALWMAVAAALLAAAAVVFGADAVRTALGGVLR